MLPPTVLRTYRAVRLHTTWAGSRARAQLEVHLWNLDSNSRCSPLCETLRELLPSCRRSSFPTTAYAVTKLCTNVERGLARLALSERV